MVAVPQFNLHPSPMSRDDSFDDISEPLKKRQRKTAARETVQIRLNELRTLLLAKGGVDVASVDPTQVPHLLSKAYSPRLNDLIEELASVANGLHTPSDASDMSEKSDDDDYAIVPSVPTREQAVPAATVPVPTSAFVMPQQKLAAPVLEPVAEPAITPKRTAYKSETEIAISRIFELGKMSNVVDASISASAPYTGPSVVSMTGFGELGRYGNQVLQYMFLKCYAAQHNIAEIQTPGWVGGGLFGLRDREVQRALPPVVEFRETMANSTFTTELLDYVRASNPGQEVAELAPDVLGEEGARGEAPRNVDIWGWYQWHTSHFAAHKDLLRQTLRPTSEIGEPLREAFDVNVRHRGGKRRTVVGLHMRLGDYKNIAASSFGYCAPAAWYLEWLERIWPTLENPVLFVASDDIAAVLRDFAKYDPVTAESAGVDMPAAGKDLKAGFFPDWFCLTQCDVLAISNSTFSFSACMMNERSGAQFFRAHYSGEMQKFEPWNAEPIVHRDMNKDGVSGMVETLQIVYKTQGSLGVAKNLLYELPYYGVRSAIMKAVLWKEAMNKARVASEEAMAMVKA